MVRWNGTSWGQLGDSLAEGDTTSVETVHDVSVAAGSSDTVFATFRQDTWIDGDLVTSVYVKQWDGSSWSVIGDEPVVTEVDDTISIVLQPKMLVRGGDTPVAAVPLDLEWETSEGGGRGTGVTVFFEWTGAAWQHLGDAACHETDFSQALEGAATTSMHTVFATDSSGAPLFAQDTSDGLQSFRLASDDNFHKLGGDVSRQFVNALDLAVSSNDVVYLLREDDGASGADEIHVSKYEL